MNGMQCLFATLLVVAGLISALQERAQDNLLIAELSAKMAGNFSVEQLNDYAYDKISLWSKRGVCTYTGRKSTIKRFTESIPDYDNAERKRGVFYCKPNAMSKRMTKQ